MEDVGAMCAKLLEHPAIAAEVSKPTGDSDTDVVRGLCLAFLQGLSPQKEQQSREFMSKVPEKFKGLADCYGQALSMINKEVTAACEKDASLKDKIKAASGGDASGGIKTSEVFWEVFFPKGVGMLDDTAKAIADLREKRTVTYQPNKSPISDPAKQILFTSNVLLGLPPASKPIQSLPYSDDFKSKLDATTKESQVAWFDHPIQIGVEPDGNEILYGLKGLNDAFAWEKEKGKVPADAKLPVLLSITCTHTGLQPIAKQYVEEECKAMPEDQKLKHLDIFLFSELETDSLVDKVIKPAALKKGFTADQVEEVRKVFGVEGQYGRHYSFLKAVLPLFNVVFPEVVATFKIDIDQVFIQDSLMAESGESALDHFKTPLWGATGKNWKGEDIELGMIAGTLCNQADWEKSNGKLFIADVKIPAADKKLAADETMFFSGLPQSVSTEAEHMMKYETVPADKCIQRIHVTGGTNGILLDTLCKFRPFAPSFIGRAEDQSYIFSTFHKTGARLGYVHKPGLIMRHDKEAFAMEAMEAARIGKMVGDYERILLFSEYTKVCCSDFAVAKDLVDPFTGCFCVPIPLLTTWVRFSLKALGFLAAGKDGDAVDFTLMGAPRVSKCVEFVTGAPSKLEETFKAEVKAWDVYYDSIPECKADVALVKSAAEIFAGAKVAM